MNTIKLRFTVTSCRPKTSRVMASLHRFVLLLWLVVAGILIYALKQQSIGDGESRMSLSKGKLIWKLKLKTEISLWKRIKSFPSTLRLRNLKSQQSPVIFDLRKIQRKIMIWLSCRHCLKRKADVLKFLRFEECFRFRDRLVCTVGLSVANKAVFSNFPGVVWTMPQANSVMFWKF